MLIQNAIITTITAGHIGIIKTLTDLLSKTMLGELNKIVAGPTGTKSWEYCAVIIQ